MNTNTMMRRRNLRVTEQLLGELEAGRYDSALTRRILAAPGAFPYLLRASFLAQAGKLASARADVDQALEHGRANPVVALAAGTILYSTRDYHRAIEQLEHAAVLSSNAAPRAYRQIVSIAGELGWDPELRRALEAGRAAAPEDPSWDAEARELPERRDEAPAAQTKIDQALADHAAGRHAEFEARWTRLRDEQAPGLLSDAARELGVTIFGDDNDDDDDAPERAIEVAVLEHAATMIVADAERPSSSYRTRDGDLRSIQPWSDPGEELHARDHEQLEQAKRMLLKALARYQGPKPV